MHHHASQWLELQHQHFNSILLCRIITECAESNFHASTVALPVKGQGQSLDKLGRLPRKVSGDEGYPPSYVSVSKKKTGVLVME